jgi:hypothetical protein
MERPGKWGGDMELTAISNIYKCRFQIHSYQNPTITIDAYEVKEHSTASRTYHLSYHMNEHYNALIPRLKDADSADSEESEDDDTSFAAFST